MSAQAGTRMDRRATLRWIAAAGAVLAAAPRVVAEAGVGARTYGFDPDLLAPTVPWDLTLDDRRRALVAALADWILPEDARSPAPSTLGIADFVDEWVSAPYPAQAGDRGVILDGLAWVEAEALRRSGVGFAEAPPAQRDAVLGELAGAGSGAPPSFLERLRFLVAAGFYTTPEGMADIGYRGNEALLGDYPGPPPEALAFLRRALAALDLRADDLGP